MAAIHIPPGWLIPESKATSEAAYQNRRAFLKKMGLGTIAVASAAHFPGCGPKAAHTTPTLLPDGPLDTIPKLAPR
ncbi:MAG: twin-arginine translocation signal domain-containing protein, partial [Bacteroidetes bacterium]|nr:twin-arginine translocation signal domain-containing protein [Bacteroidota bacterium]